MTSADEAGLLPPGGPAPDDAAFLRAMLDAEAALARAQAALGLIPAEAAEAITAAAREGRFDLRGLAERARLGGNPVIPLVAELRAAAGEYAHHGATSQDILDTAMMLLAHRALGPVLADLDRLTDSLAALAAEHRDTPMPGRTLTQHAVPTTFGLKAAGWRALTLDAHDRLHAVRHALPVQLGGAAGTLAAFGLGGDLRLLGEYARQAGLAEPALPWHVLRTPVADLAAALAFTSGALGKAAADVLVLSRTEIGEVAEGSGGASSAMPHKSNPVRATLVAAAARQVPALAAVLFGSMVAEDERPAGAWHAEWQPLREALRLVAGAARDMAELAGNLRVRPERMRANLDLTGGLIVSEWLAVRLGRARAGELLSRAAAEGVPLAEALAGLGLDEPLDPAAYTGSAAALVDRALRRTRADEREENR